MYRGISNMYVAPDCYFEMNWKKDDSRELPVGEHRITR